MKYFRGRATSLDRASHLGLRRIISKSFIAFRANGTTSITTSLSRFLEIALKAKTQGALHSRS